MVSGIVSHILPPFRNCGIILPLSPTSGFEVLQNNENGAIQGKIFRKKAIHRVQRVFNLPFFEKIRHYEGFVL
jgi:hypothetical protein